MSQYSLKQTTPSDIPISLLLEADPSQEEIKKYWDKCDWVAAKDTATNTIIGACGYLIHSGNRSEIMNLIVEEKYRAKGIGKELLKFSINKIRISGCKEIYIATGNSSINQLALYQKVGFRMIEIISDYFIKNYAEPIFENGIQCRDRIQLCLLLNTEVQNET